MSWSWSNPSENEAEEAYSYYKQKYYNAANQKKASERQERTYASEKQAASSEMNSLSSQKMNLERRLSGIEEILKMLEGTGGWFSTNVPGAIEKARSSIAKADDSFRSSIRMSGGASAASLQMVLKTKTVDADPRSAAALSAFRAEKTRLQEEIANLQRQITELSNRISYLSAQIRACNSVQASLQSAMNSYSYEMHHYKKFMY